MSDTCVCGEPIHLDGGVCVHNDQYQHCFGDDRTDVATPDKESQR